MHNRSYSQNSCRLCGVSGELHIFPEWSKLEVFCLCSIDKLVKMVPKYILCVIMVLGFFNMAKLPFHIETPSFFVLPKNIKNSHFKIKCQTLHFFVVVVIPSRLISQCFGFFSKGKN